MITKLNETNCIMCAWCRKMIKIKGEWQRIAVSSIAAIADTKCSHGMCPGCYEEAITQMETKYEDTT